MAVILQQPGIYFQQEPLQKKSSFDIFHLCKEAGIIYGNTVITDNGKTLCFVLVTGL